MKKPTPTPLRGGELNPSMKHQHIFELKKSILTEIVY